ncbi:hypothetical protein ACL02U_03450 [Streptomyces sp. MS06]|uniref:hypothetical protein n=1 Tax=Streptomyces sp. MS06 TaxID=3385974 RepID=UPI0039A06E59
MPEERKPARTALEEVLREIEEAELRPLGERGRRRGEAAEAVTPSVDAQQESLERAEED